MSWLFRLLAFITTAKLHSVSATHPDLVDALAFGDVLQQRSMKRPTRTKQYQAIPSMDMFRPSPTTGKSRLRRPACTSLAPSRTQTLQGFCIGGSGVPDIHCTAVPAPESQRSPSSCAVRRWSGIPLSSLTLLPPIRPLLVFLPYPPVARARPCHHSLLLPGQHCTASTARLLNGFELGASFRLHLLSTSFGILDLVLRSRQRKRRTRPT